MFMYNGACYSNNCEQDVQCANNSNNKQVIWKYLLLLAHILLQL